LGSKVAIIQIVITLLFSLMVSSPVWAKNWNNSSDYEEPRMIKFPSDFFVDKIKGASCYGRRDKSSEPYLLSRFNFLIKEDVSGLIKIETGTLDSTSTSLTVNHDYISRRWASLLDLTYDAASSGDVNKIRSIKQVLVLIAKNRTVLGAASPDDADGGCWKNGNENSTCRYHHSQHAGFVLIATLISAIVLEEHLSKDERKILDAYFNEAYEHFINPLATKPLKALGFYEFADYGIGVLAYSRWTRDEKLARLELRRRYFSLVKKIENSGYINNNSYRGYRGYWYHTLGAENALAYSMIARNFGADFFNMPKLKAKFQKLVEKTIEGNEDAAIFEKLPQKGKNRITDKSKARPHMHQLAINLPVVLKNEFGVNVKLNEVYLRKSKSETVSRFVGFNADCYYQSNNH
jgi:hypothetical protein